MPRALLCVPYCGKSRVLLLLPYPILDKGVVLCAMLRQTQVPPLAPAPSSLIGTVDCARPLLSYIYCFLRSEILCILIIGGWIPVKVMMKYT